MTRPPRETYVRMSRPGNRVGVCTEPGVEFRAGDDFEQMTGLLYDICFKADTENPCSSVAELAEHTAALIVEVWPDRAYFVEVHDLDGWIQIFQPFGIPRNQ